MRVLETVLFEFVLGYVLQLFSYFLAIYALCRGNIIVKRYIIASIVTSVISYLVTFFPISYGIHTILNSICIFLFAVLYLKIQPLSTIKALLIITVFLLIAEFADVYILTSILGKEKFDSLMSDGLYKSLLGMPPSIIFAFLSVVSYYLLVLKRRKKSAAHGETCS